MKYPQPRFRSALRRWFVSLCCVLVCVNGAVFALSNSSSAPTSKTGVATRRTANKPQRKRPQRPRNRIEEAERERENPAARQDWFTIQRSYPSGVIPADARRRAWEARPRQRFEPNVPVLTWRSIGPAPTLATEDNRDLWGDLSGRINAVAVSPADPNLILVGAATGGVWRSTDGGETFKAMTDDQVDLAVGSIVFAPSNPAIVYVGMGDSAGGYFGSGILKSTDAGQTFKRVNDASIPTVGQIAKIDVDPKDPNRVYVAQYASLSGNTSFSGGLYVSTDGGVKWQRTLAGLSTDVAVHPTLPGVVYSTSARVSSDGTSGLYKSTDGGLTWVRARSFSFSSVVDARVAVTPANPQLVYLYGGNGSAISLQASTDGGNTWASRSIPPDADFQFGYNTYLVADPTNADTVYVGTTDVFRSTDGGNTFANLTDVYGRVSRSHPDQHALAVTRDGILIGNDGGLFKLPTGSNQFRALNRSLTLSQFVSLQLHPTNPNISYGGTQDNGTQRRLSSGAWEDFPGGDGGNCVINGADPSIVFTSYYFAQLLRWRDNGNAFDRTIGRNSTFGESNGNPRMSFYPPFVGNGVDANLYLGTWRLFISKDAGNTWTAPAGTLDITRGTVNGRLDVLEAIGVGRSNTNVIYTGSRYGRISLSTDEGKTWNDVTGTLPNRFVTGIRVDPVTPATAYVTFSGYGTGHVFRTTDSGTSWTNLSANLPDVPANTLLIDPRAAGTLYLGTDIGVFRSTNNGTSWEAFNNGMPPVIVMSLAAQPSGLIQAGTYGRGIYELQLIDVPDDTTPPQVTVLAPAGGETLTPGSAFSITWKSTDDRGVTAHDVALSLDNGATFPTAIATGLAGTAQTFAWTVPTTESKTTQVRVTATDAAKNQGLGTSKTFIVGKAADTKAPTVTVTAPTAGTTVESAEGTKINVTWTSTDDTGVTSHAVSLAGKRNGTSFETQVVTGLPGTATSFQITVTKNDAVTEAQVIVAASDAAQNVGKGQSGSFTIVAPKPPDTEKPVVSAVTLSTKKVKRKVDPKLVISWKSTDNVSVASQEIVYADNGQVFSRTVVSGLPGATQTFEWTVSSSVPKTTNGLVKVIAKDAAGNSGEAVSTPVTIK